MTFKLKVKSEKDECVEGSKGKGYVQGFRERLREGLSYNNYNNANGH